MGKQDFEKAFSDFIDGNEYDEAQSSMFKMVRISCQAGWESAGGNRPSPQPVTHLALKRSPKEPSK
ncbi:MAG: hypothetical protein ACOX8Q_00250 [Christensenellales bacterium]|jgi:hypothetical protein